jgi:hypothetical protein
MLMFFIYVLKDWFRCYASRFETYNGFRGIGIFGVEPDTPRPPIPDAPPMHPCPDHREEVSRPFF